MGGGGGGGGSSYDPYPNLDDNLMRQFYKGGGAANWSDDTIKNYFANGQLIFKNNPAENQSAFRTVYGDKRVNYWLGIPEPAKLNPKAMPKPPDPNSEGKTTAEDATQAATQRVADVKRAGNDTALQMTRARKIAESLFGSFNPADPNAIKYKNLLGE